MDEHVRNIAIIGHGGCGKTTLADTFLFRAGAVKDKGDPAKGTSAFCTEPEEIDRHITITPHIAHLTWNKVLVHVVDTPGYFNFLENTRAVIPGIEGVIVLASALEGVKPETERLWEMVQRYEVPAIAFVNAMDEDQGSFEQAIQELNETLSIDAVPVILPIGSGADFKGFVDLVEHRAFFAKGGLSSQSDIPDSMADEVESARLELMEKVAETSDELIEKYLENGSLSEEELRNGLRRAVLTRTLLPCLCGSALSDVGIDHLLDAVVAYLPDPISRSETRDYEGVNDESEAAAVSRRPLDTDPFSAVTIKTSIDPFSGHLSIVRVISGTLTHNEAIYNSTRQTKQKAAHVYRIMGKELEQVDRLSAGEIGAIGKLDETRTGDTLCSVQSQICFPQVEFADAALSYAVQAEKKSEEKVSSGLEKLAQEDPTLHLHRDPETHDIILSGMGQAHLETTLARLGRKFGGKATLKAPQVPYRETIRKKVKVQGKLKKQTGGHGQFANCWLEVEPLPRDGGFEFEDHIVGGIIPKQFIPSVEKGVREAMQKGVLGGYSVVDVRVKLVDGSFHAVDSSDYAFQVAGSLGFRAAMEQADAVILEPIMHIDVLVPEEFTGDIIKDLSSRRGKVLGMETTKGSKQKIVAEAPMAELLEYGNILSSLSSGRGIYSMSIATYSELPDQLATKMLETKAAVGQN